MGYWENSREPWPASRWAPVGDTAFGCLGDIRAQVKSSRSKTKLNLDTFFLTEGSEKIHNQWKYPKRQKNVKVHYLRKEVNNWGMGEVSI